MNCERCHDNPATRNVRLSNALITIVRAFCDECATILCGDEPVAGSTNADGRQPLYGTDLGAVVVNTDSPITIDDGRLL